MQLCGGFINATHGAHSLAWRGIDAAMAHAPMVVFLHGFRSDKQGTKAQFLHQFCLENELAYRCFDLSGHGESGGHYTDFTVGDWLADVLHVIDTLTHHHPLLIVGSSLGGWLGLHGAAQRAARVKALLAIAPAPDFPTELVLPNLTAAQQNHYALHHEIVDEKSGWADPTRFTRRFMEESVNHNCLHAPPPLAMPVRLFQGMKDEAVPWTQTLKLFQNMDSAAATLTLFKEGDHRLNMPEALEALGQALSGFVNK